MSTNSAPQSEDLITIVQASQETGLSRYTLWRQTRTMDQNGLMRLQVHDHGGKRASGGGVAIRVTRGDLHEYLRSRGRGRVMRIVSQNYRAPQGHEPLPTWMYESWSGDQQEMG